MKNKNLESFYKDIANRYTEYEGSNLKKLSNDLNTKKYDYKEKLDKRIKNNIRLIKSKELYPLIALLATLILIFSLGTKFIINNNKVIKYSSDNIKINSYLNKETDIKFMSTKIPENYNIINLKYDIGEKIFYLENEGDEFILRVSNDTNKFLVDGFEYVVVDNKKIYIKDYEDYKLSTFEINNEHYTITTSENLNKTIEISKNLIKKI